MFRLSHGADIEVRNQDVSNDTEDRSPRLSDLVPNRAATISASDRPIEPNTSSLVSAIKQNLRAKLVSRLLTIWPHFKDPCIPYIVLCIVFITCLPGIHMHACPTDSLQLYA